MSKFMKQSRRNGFTLIELLLVLVILVVLAGIVVPKLVGRAEESKKKAAKIDISNISSALRMFEVDNGHFPTSDEGLQALVSKPGTATAEWHAYLERLPQDPWEHPYVYRQPGSHNNDYDLFSTGPDGQEGGNDDIVNW
jgi:general secretion pathway protein G